MPVHSGKPPAELSRAISAWNMMGGIDWAGIELVMDVLDIDDIESLLAHLMLIRDDQNAAPDE